MSLNQIKQLLNTAIDQVIDNKEPEIPEKLPEDIIKEIEKYYFALNFMASTPYFSVDVIKDMKRAANRTLYVIKRKIENDEIVENPPE